MCCDRNFDLYADICSTVPVVIVGWVPTADQINSTVPIAQIPRPSSTELDHCLVGLVRDLFPTESAGVWSSSDRVAVELIG